MLHSLHFYTILLLFVATVSCTGQNKTEPLPKQETAVSQKPKAIDPYFFETKAENSPFGPQSICRNILEDRNGNIWLATWEGIIRYDGTSFSNITNQEDLKRFHVFTLLEDRKGDLWFGTIGAGIYHYDGKNFTHFSTEEGLVNDRVQCLFEDKSGKIWIGTAGGISVYDGNGFRNFTKADGMPDHDVNAIIEVQDGKFWIGARGEASFYDGQDFTKITHDLGTPFINARSIIQDSKGNIWLGGNDGLWRYDGSIYRQYTSAFVGYIHEDSQGNMWTSSESPTDRQQWLISRYDVKTLSYPKAIATPIITEKGMFFGILEDAQGGIWFGSLKGVGRYEGSKIERFRRPGALD